jgi:hypothetical protein
VRFGTPWADFLVVTLHESVTANALQYPLEPKLFAERVSLSRKLVVGSLKIKNLIDPFAKLFVEFHVPRLVDQFHNLNALAN